MATLIVFYRVLIGPPNERQVSIRAADPAVSQSVDETANMLEESRRALDSGDFERGAELLTSLLEDDPENYIHLKHLAIPLHELHRYREEAEIWERYMLVAPTPANGCPAIARAWSRAGEEAKAIDAYERCYEIAPNPDNIFNLARQYEGMHRWMDATRLYEEGAALSPDYADMNLGLGRMYMHSDREVDAQRIAEKVLARKPDSADALLLMGTAAKSNGDLAAAKKALTHGVKVSPDYDDMRLMLGMVLESEGDSTGAAEQYRKALANSPDRRDIRARLERLRDRP